MSVILCVLSQSVKQIGPLQSKWSSQSKWRGFSRGKLIPNGLHYVTFVSIKSCSLYESWLNQKLHTYVRTTYIRGAEAGNEREK